MTESSQLKHSPLHAIHEKLGATFTDFGGWNMPLKYDKELAEHNAVRTKAGIFDLSHMGEFTVKGPDAAAFLDYTLLSSLSTTKIGQAKYSMIVAEDGGIIDDLITYRLGEDYFYVVPNAGNTSAVWEAYTQRAEGFAVELENVTERTALIAVQGPEAEGIVTKLVAEDKVGDVEKLGYYRCLQLEVAGVDAMLARTGYTGEDGFEIFVDAEQGPAMWNAVTEAAAHTELTPCGLASRDSLRMEAAMPLYGNELSRDITPVEAGMARAFAKKEADFVGKAALAEHQQDLAIVGLVSDQKRAARPGSEVYLGDTKIGTVTSGQPSPTLKYPVALALVDVDHAEVGTGLEVDIRGKRYPFRIAETPFYKRPTK